MKHTSYLHVRSSSRVWTQGSDGEGGEEEEEEGGRDCRQGRGNWGEEGNGGGEVAQRWA